MFSFLSALGGGPKLTDTFGLQDGDLLILVHSGDIVYKTLRTSFTLFRA
jgi:hypothetical protein